MLSGGHPILSLSVTLIAGILAGAAVSRLKLPRMTGQIVVGALLGPSVIGLMSAEALHALRPITQFALGLIAVAVGNHLSYRRLRNAYKRLIILLAFEVLLTPLLIFGAMYLGGVRDWTLGAMLAAMAIATAPATVVATIAESRARGVFVKTLVAAVALNNMACILLFEVARALARDQRGGTGGDPWALVLTPLGQLVEPIVIGFLVGGALVLVTRRVVRSELLASASITAILFTAGLSEYLEISPLLSCLFLGVTLANLTPDRDEIGHTVFSDFENAIFAVFFTLAGMELDFAFLVPAGLLVALYVVARIVGKVASASAAMALAGATAASRRYLGLALIPQAGVAIGLVLVVRGDPVLSDISQLFLAVGITAVAINEVIGPLTTRFAIQRSGEVGMDKPDVLDFLHEEHILTDLGPVSLEEAILRLTRHLYESHSVEHGEEAFLEEALSVGPANYLGRGLAMPHVRLPYEGEMVGVIGISREGLTNETRDGERIRCVMLLATPKDQSDRHLEVLATFAKTVSFDPLRQAELYTARTPAHVYELLHPKGGRGIDQVLEELEEV